VDAGRDATEAEEGVVAVPDEEDDVEEAVNVD
jgi:hypothetical protein